MRVLYIGHHVACGFINPKSKTELYQWVNNPNPVDAAPLEDLFLSEFYRKKWWMFKQKEEADIKSWRIR